MLKRPLRCLPLLNKMAWLRNFRAVWLLFLRTGFCSQEQKSSENGFGKREGFFFVLHGFHVFQNSFQEQQPNIAFFLVLGRGIKYMKRMGWVAT